MEKCNSVLNNEDLTSSVTKSRDIFSTQFTKKIETDKKLSSFGLKFNN